MTVYQLPVLKWCLQAIFMVFGMSCTAALSTEWHNVPPLPAEVKPSIERGSVPIALESGDFNGDGQTDDIPDVKAGGPTPLIPTRRFLLWQALAATL